MTYRQYIVTLALSTFTSGVGWLLVLVNIDPLGAGLYGVIIFLGSFWLLAVSSLALAWLIVGVRREPDAVLTRIATRSFARALAVGSFMIILLFSERLRHSGSSRAWTLVAWLGIAIITDRVIVRLTNRPRGLPPDSSL